ncbi:MAG: adenosylcobinamide-GDP ribazoletransferase [Candidatus Lokiarchaeota archaeon]|nr:adenosylcobinamide-GDP ribazoletransferase [Candidatus Lokiarchaeota archaeon]
MKFIKDIRNCLSFLTRFSIKAKIDLFEDVAPKIWIFPIIGMILGFFSSFINMILSIYLPILLTGFLTLGILLYITGGHHTDGLFDFGDGIMAIGTSKRKIEIMHDSAIGTGGIILGFTVLMLSGISISYSNKYIILILVLSEISAKFSMVTACSLGKSAKTPIADIFIKLNNKKNMILSLVFSLFLILFCIFFINIFNEIYKNSQICKLLFSQQNSVYIYDIIQVLIVIFTFIIGSIFPMIFILKISNKNFNGLTGDCIGALNDITRLFVLILGLLINSIGYI